MTNRKLWQELSDTQKRVTDLSLVVMQLQIDQREAREELLHMVMDAHRLIKRLDPG